ncbi:periplasmic heavy metal sensor [bacterium]|nr:periplasmic heavy metal sensor [bacterium]
MRTRIFLVALISVFVVAGVVVAQGPRAGMGKGMGMGYGLMGLGPRMIKELELTDDQVTKLKQIHADFMTATQTTRDQLKTKMQEMAQLWMQDATADQLKAKLAEVDPLKAELRDAAIDSALQARAVLTEEQREKVRQMIKEKTEDGMGMCWGLGAYCGVGCPMAE